MKINADIIRTLTPCADRFGNFLNHYNSFDGDLTEFVSLENITYSDKVWVVTRLFTRDQNVRWSIACAESIQHHFTAKYPDNKALQNLFDYLKTFETFENIIDDQKTKIRELHSAAANAAANAADAAAYAAYAAANAAAYAADAAAYTADAAAYAAVYAADAAAYTADAAEEEQRNLNLLLMIALEEK